MQNKVRPSLLKVCSINSVSFLLDNGTDEHSGLVVKCLTRNRGVAGSPEALCCVLEHMTG